MLCSGIGAIIAVVVIRWFPRLRPLTLGAIIIGLIAIAIFQMPAGIRVKSDTLTFTLSRLLLGMRFTSYPFWPSWWVSRGITASAKGQWLQSTFFFGILSSNMLVTVLATEFIGKLWMYTAWKKQYETQYTTSPRHRSLWVLPRKILSVFPSDVRAIVLKDIRNLFRDPVQWTQGLIFFGLLGLYFFYLRNLGYHRVPIVWRNLIAFLNIFSLSAIMCSFCSRFIYPQLSLEGHAFWILGLAPTNMGRILMIKFFIAFFGLLTISVTLLAISMFMLNMEWSVRIVALIIAIAMSFALCGLATGLGAVFLDLKQSNPVAIISGFGGTLNLVLSLLYMISAIIPFGILFHTHYTHQISSITFRYGLLASGLWLTIITAITTFLPLALGRKSLLARDY